MNETPPRFRLADYLVVLTMAAMLCLSVVEVVGHVCFGVCVWRTIGLG